MPAVAAAAVPAAAAEVMWRASACRRQPVCAHIAASDMTKLLKMACVALKEGYAQAERIYVKMERRKDGTVSSAVAGVGVVAGVGAGAGADLILRTGPEKLGFKLEMLGIHAAVDNLGHKRRTGTPRAVGDAAEYPLCAMRRGACIRGRACGKRAKGGLVVRR